MVTLPTKREVLAIEEAHRAAQARLGIAGAYLALQGWGAVNPQAPEVSSGEWIKRSLHMIRALRRKSGRLAVAYYRLARAIETGYTLGIPEESGNPEQMTMGKLRRQYLDLLLEIAGLADPDVEPTKTPDSDEAWLEDELKHVADSGDATLITSDLGLYIEDLIDVTEYDTDGQEVAVEDFEWLDLEEDFESIEERYRDNLYHEAVVSAEKKRAQLEADQEEQTAEVVLSSLQDSHGKSGNRGAGKVDEAGLDAGRSVIDHAMNNDARVKMVARGTGPNPCAFCSMLASRGFAYSSILSASERKLTPEKIANFTYRNNPADADEIKKFHPNCHCFPVVRWADIPDPTAPGRSEEFANAWHKVTRGYSYHTEMKDGKTIVHNDALNAWRRHWNKVRREEKRKANIPGG